MPANPAGEISTVLFFSLAIAFQIGSSSGANWRSSTPWSRGREEKGEVALEQAYLDFLIKPWLNVRGGMVLAPVGIINERHEPPAYNGVERPFVETLIIPSTWREMGVGLTGDLGRGFRYRTYMVSALRVSA